MAGSTIRPGSQVVSAHPGRRPDSFASDTALASMLWETGEYRTRSSCTPVDFVARHLRHRRRRQRRPVCRRAMRAVGPSGRVLAIEPMASTAELLRANVENNGCRNVEVVVAAAGAVAGEVELKVALGSGPPQHRCGDALRPDPLEPGGGTRGHARRPVGRREPAAGELHQDRRGGCRRGCPARCRRHDRRTHGRS